MLLLSGILLSTGADSPKSTLAPKLEYTSTFAFLHSHNKLPKVLLLLPESESSDKPGDPEPAVADGAPTDGAPAPTKPTPGEPPSWFTSAAVNFKKGRDKSASFGFIEGGEAAKVASRFGITDLPAVIGCSVDGNSGGHFTVFDGTLGESSGKAVREVKAFVQKLVAGDIEGNPLPAFPPPDVPLKAAALSLTELTHDNLPTHCFGGSKSICMVALLPAGAESCPEAFTELARRHRNDAIQFVWLKAARQLEFASGFGLSAEQLPRLVAVRTGKRSRYAVADGGLDSYEMKSFVDRILGGGMSFKRLAELPELVPPYLMDTDNEPAAEKEEL